MTSSISSIIQTCLKQLGLIISSQELSKYDSEVLPDLWSDEIGRLRVWTANIGAHQTGQSSLDYRLRDASHLKDQTLRALGRLQRTIQDLQDLLHEPGLGEEFSSDSDSEDEDQTEIQRIYHSLQDTIGILFKNSMSIRKPAQHDRLLGVKRSDTVAFEPFDRQHVANKFPSADDAIIARLGLGISQRRATLQYRERHHLKLAQGLDRVIGDDEDTKSTMLSETVATQFVEKSLEDYPELQSTISQTSCGQTIMEGRSDPAIPPPPRNSLDGEPFECPYCFILITIKDRHSWAQHVLHDFMPYMCVFSDCRTPHRLWESRRQWYAHLQNEHSIPDEKAISVECPLCRLSLSCGKPLERHLGRHLQELALFALPHSSSDEDEDEGVSISTKSEDITQQSGSAGNNKRSVFASFNESHDDNSSDPSNMLETRGRTSPSHWDNLDEPYPMENRETGEPLHSSHEKKRGREEAISQNILQRSGSEGHNERSPFASLHESHDENSSYPSSELETMDSSQHILHTPTTSRLDKTEADDRVLHCIYPGCDKVFDHAEQCRRHELSHTTEISYKCSWVDCEKEFSMFDLLALHMERM